MWNSNPFLERKRGSGKKIKLARLKPGQCRTLEEEEPKESFRKAQIARDSRNKMGWESVV